MRVKFITVGKTNEKYFDAGEKEYEKRLTRYLQYHRDEIPELRKGKSLTESQIKQKEGEEILKRIQISDFVMLLDENGKTYSSVDYSKYLEKLNMQGHKQIVFVIGGAYGFSDAVYQRANSKLSLSLMTFSHQMVRMFFLEQLYRAMTIQRNEPYHHQ